MVGKKIIYSLLILIAINAHAQVSSNKKSGIITYKTFGPFRLNGEKISRKELKEELYKVPAAIPIYKKAKTSEILGYSFLVPALVFALVHDQNDYHLRRDGTFGPKRGFLVTALISEGVSLYFLLHSISLYKKSIRAHNNAVITIY